MTSVHFSATGALILFVLCSVLAGCKRSTVEDHELKGKAMGTTWSVKYSGPWVEDLEEKIAARLEELEKIFSTWRKGSVVTRLNRGESVDDLPREFDRVMELALVIRRKTSGAFDVGVGEAVAAAGFGSRFAGRLDFSGIAKGFAVDEIGVVLGEAGVDDFLIELGGELLAGGDRDWRVGLESADPGSFGEVRRVISLRGAAVATSGSYRLFRGDANHLIDPRTGQPVAHDCVSVSVVADSCAEADALATALMVLGSDEGMALADSEGLRAVFVRRLSDGTLEEVGSLD